MSEWVSIKNLGSIGIEPDRMPENRPAESFDIAQNVRPVGQDLEGAGGYTTVAAIPASADTPVPDKRPDFVYCDGTITNPECYQEPNEYLWQEKDDGTYYVNRRYSYQWGDRDKLIVGFPVNFNGEAYDISYRIPRIGQDPGYLGGVRVRVINSSSVHEVRVETLNDDGSVATTETTYDASSRWSTGVLDWVFVSFHELTVTVNLKDVEVYSADWPTGAIGTLMEFINEWTLANHTGDWYIPLAIWTWDQDVWDCLISGSDITLEGQKIFRYIPHQRWDPNQAADDSNVAWDRMFVTPDPVGDGNNRTVYLDLFDEKLTGKRYWEVIRVDRDPFTTDPSDPEPGSEVPANDSVDVRAGLSQLGVKTRALGEYFGSVAVNFGDGNLWINEGSSNFGDPIGVFVVFCVDFDTGDLWVGVSTNRYHTLGTGLFRWAGGKNPYEGHTAVFNIFGKIDNTETRISYKPHICVSFKDQGVQLELVSSALSCTFTPPPGFSYLDTGDYVEQGLNVS